MIATFSTAAVLILVLSACFSGSSQRSTDGGDDELTTLGEDITDSSPNIESTSVSTKTDGLTQVLYVRPTITSPALTSSELDALLQLAFTRTEGTVSTIEIRTVDAQDDPVDLEAAAGELGIHFLSHTNSISYSTTVLAKTYGS